MAKYKALRLLILTAGASALAFLGMATSAFGSWFLLGYRPKTPKSMLK
jgi:cyclic lactone autoinducer peptide